MNRHRTCSRRLQAALVLAAGFLLVLAPWASASTLFALIDTGELYASADGGVTWSAQSTLPVSDAAGLLAASSQSELYLTSRSGTVYQSQNAGNSWTAVGSVSASDVVDMAGRTDGALLVLTESGLVWLSTDDGASFTALASMTASDLVSLARGADGTLLAVTATGTVRRSDDDGATWTAVGAIPVSDAVAIRPAGSSYFVLTDPGVAYESMDLGATWTAVGTVSQVGMCGLVEDEGDLVAINRTGLTARSADGASWSWVGTVNQLNVVALANDVPQTVGIPSGPDGTPRLVLSPPRPNPVRAGGAVIVSFELDRPGEVGLALFDTRGRRVASRTAGRFEAGASETAWSLPSLASGVYFLRLVTVAGGQVATRLIILD